MLNRYFLGNKPVFVYTINNMSKTLIIGTALIDHIIYSDFSLQEKACNKVPGFLSSGGSMRNVSHNLAVLGYQTDFLAIWGNDNYAEILQSELRQLGVNTFGPTISSPTPIFTFIKSPQKQILLSTISHHFYLSADYLFPYQDYDYLITDNSDESLLDSIIKVNPTIKLIISGFLPPNRFHKNIIGVILNRNEFFAEKGDYKYQDITPLFPDSWLIVSLDNDGLFYSYQENSALLKNQHKQTDGYTVGCGDALLAGLFYALNSSADFITALSYGQKLAEMIYQSPNSVIVDKELFAFK